MHLLASPFCAAAASWRRLTLPLAGVLLGSTVAASAAGTRTLPTHLARLGFYDAAHRQADGFCFSEVIDLDPAGWVVGASASYAADDQGWTAWVNHEGVTRRVGYYDPLHTRSDGLQETRPIAVNNQGVSIGISTRFYGAEWAGQSAWIADRWGGKIKVGFYDPAHTDSTGVKFNVPIALNNRNHAIGYALHRETGALTAWLTSSTGAIHRIGILDATHAAPDGTHWSAPVAINDSSHVVGVSEHHVPGESPGATTWLRHPDGRMRRIGFQSGIHRSAGGQHSGEVQFLTHSGWMAGIARRYGPGASESNGQTAWLTHVNGPNRAVGFYDGVHTTPAGLTRSSIHRVNENGWAIGVSAQYPAWAGAEFDYLGTTAWIAGPDGTTTRAGLYDDNHTHDGFSLNTPAALNGLNCLTGTARRFGFGGADLGFDAWVADADGATTLLGLGDVEHTRADGYRASGADLLNQAGHVAGSSVRFHGDWSARGSTAWLYDRGTGDYVRFVLSVRPFDGYAESQITHLHEDGSVVGRYVLFDEHGRHMGDRVFIYHPATGVLDLSELFAADVEASGWDQLAQALFTSGEGLIAGLAIRRDPLSGELREQAVFRVE